MRYLDYAASAPLREVAREAWLGRDDAAGEGNPSSLHGSGRAARAELEDARERLAQAFGAQSHDIVWTAGGTEADALAIGGLFYGRNVGSPAQQPAKPLVLISAVEHHAVLESARLLAARAGAEVVELPVGADGIIDLGVLADHLSRQAERIALISVMWANNETGAIQPIRRVTELASAWGVPVHSDAVQAAGKVALEFSAAHLAAASVSAHKLGGPVGIGALLLARRMPVAPIWGGGGQERGLRSGTLDRRGARAFAAAATAAVAQREAEAVRLESLLAPFDALVADAEHLVRRTPAGPADHVPGLRLVTAEGCAGDVLSYLLDRAGIAVATGAACSAGVTQASHVLLAMGCSPRVAGSGIRVSLGHESTADDVEALVAALPTAVATARQVGWGGR